MYKVRYNELFFNDHQSTTLMIFIIESQNPESMPMKAMRGNNKADINMHK